MAALRQFIHQFIHHHKEVGSIIPSSKFLAKKMTETIDFEKPVTIVELGPGTGIFTFELLKKMNTQSKLILIESNAFFYQHLENEIKDPRVVFVSGSAEHLKILLDQSNFYEVDFVISSLPLTNFSRRIKNKILTQIHSSLNCNGKFIQFQYSIAVSKLIKQIFTNVKTEFTLLNFPPAFIFSCTKEN